jgi:hypothetical protein
MKKYFSLLSAILCMSSAVLAQTVTLTTSPTAASNISQGSTNNIVYAVKMDVAVLPVTVTNIQFNLIGTHDNNDLTVFHIYFNPSAPTVAGASFMAANVPATFAAPHIYNTNFNIAGSQTIAAGATGYFIIVVNTDAAATSGNTVKINGVVNPVTFGYSASPTIINNQTDAAGTQTILAAGVTLTTSTLAASNITQGTINNMVYAVRMDVTSLPITVSSIQFTLSGTHDNNDLVSYHVYFNPTAPTVSGASFMAANIPATFAAPHAYNTSFTISASQTIAAGGSGYFIIVVNTSSSANSGNTVKVNGLVTPVSFGYNTSPTITNNQTNAAGTQTILASGVTLTTSTLAASNITQGTTNNMVYAVRMDVTSMPITVSSIQFTLSGTHDNNDLVSYHVYFNPTAPTVSGASFMAANIPATFAAPHTYNTNFTISGSQTIAASGSGYFIIVINTSSSANSGNTVKVNGLVNPVSFGYSTSPTITNNQTDAAGTQTILAAGVTLTTSTLAASNIAQGTINNIVYAVRMDVTSLPVTVNNIQFTLTGTHDNDDLTVFHIYFNPTAPTVSGASFMAANIPATFAAPHTYNTNFTISGSQTIAAGGSGYFIIVVNTSSSANSGNTVKLNGLVNPVSFGYSTSPTITNNQTDVAGTQTILAAGVTLTTSILPAANITQGTINNIVYAVKMDVTSLPITVSSIQFTLSGTHDNNDLESYHVYFNPTAATVSGASFMAANIPATFAAPHAYNTNFTISGSQTIAAGGSGYFIIVVNTNAVATAGNTVKLNGLTNPITFGYTTSPPITNNQTDAAGVQTISSILPLTLLSFKGNITEKQEVKIEWKTAHEINSKDFEIEWSEDGLHFTKINVLPSAGNSTQELSYNYLHKTPADGANYYRLKMQDIDGRFIYSPIIKIIVTTNAFSVTAFPNPVINYVQLDMKAPKKETIVLTLHSADGKMIASKQFAVTKGNNLLKWDVQFVCSGSYIISSTNIPLPTINIIKK